MEQTNSQELDKKIFSDLLHDPSAITAGDREVLGSLIEKYPYSQLLRSFYTRSLLDSGSDTFEKELAKAALFATDRSVLRAIIEDPGSIIASHGTGSQAEDPADPATFSITAEEKHPEVPPVETSDISPYTEITQADVLSAEESAGSPQNPPPIDEMAIEGLDRTEAVFKPEIDTDQNISHSAIVEAQHKVSMYDDDKMPYSFLWWLTKTRKEHTENYQPYVSSHPDNSQSIKRNSVDQLSSQIIENIFHLQSPVDELGNAPKTVPFQVKRKEDYILEKFIREEPQIKPPDSEKLDNENKARKSAEDSNDLVSETLAKVYMDQMLFHKALDTYKKLSLKFPEKSTYFADQIRELEKKLN